MKFIPAIVALLAATTVVRAAEIRRDGAGNISITGIVAQGEADKFKAIIGKIGGTVILNSPGGHVRDAILIGNQVRYHSYSTRVPRRARCDSACVVIWLAGTHRELDAKSQLGLHRVRKADKRAVDEERGNALVAKIMLEYGAPVAFVNLALATDPKSMSYVKYEKAKAWGLIDHTSTQTVRYQPGSEIWPLNMNKAPSFLRPQYPSLVKEASETHPAATTPAEPTPQPQQVNVETLAVRSVGDEERPQTKMPDTTLQKLLFGR